MQCPKAVKSGKITRRDDSRYLTNNDSVISTIVIDHIRFPSL